MGHIVYLLGSVVSLIGWIMLVIKGFQKSVIWGLINLLTCGLGALIFGIINWSDEGIRKALFIFLAGWVLCIIGGMLGGAGAVMQMFHH